ncbi:MAG TPA: sulfite exporter TauE/SafE family protein [Terriglobales bacterium]|jgi:uncharacterized membrane protein YfcA|nr:sulfite exporter TauE/SafE family protein [Terriglobales bacterium]
MPGNRVFWQVASEIIFLLGAGVLGGALNAMAGGGGFITFPALIFIGMPPIQATATYTAAMLPGGIASIGAYRRSYTPETRALLVPVLLVGVIGGLFGALLLLRTPPALFMHMVPWLLLSATVLFWMSPRIVPWMQVVAGRWKHGGLALRLFPLVLQFLIAIYIGFFGAGAGILVLAMLALMGVTNIHAMNGLKVILIVVVNLVAIAMYALAHAIVWKYALLMMVGTTVGGYGGAWFSQRLSAVQVRNFVFATGIGMTVYFFVR